MEAPDTLNKLRLNAIAAFEPYIERKAQALIAVIGESIFYSHIDEAAKQIVIDRRAIIFAMLLVGTSQRYSEYASTASWFSDWLRSRLPGRPVDPLVNKSMHSDRMLSDLVGKGFQLIASRSISDILPTAASYAERTMNRPRAGLRHVFVAMLTDPRHTLEIGELNWKLNPADRDDLCSTLLRHIEAEPEGAEDAEAWKPIFSQVRPIVAAGTGTASGGASAGARAAPARPASPAYFVSTFSADRTTDHDGDPLETEADVLAMARLICHEDADPPISIGVFGGWGSGKSTFMEALQWEIANLARPAAEKVQPAEEPNFVSPVVQIRFNAWQFADADLWASLTAEFFDQLRAGGFEGGGKRIHGQLVEKVSEHVRGLGKDASDRRAAQARAEEVLRAAQAEQANAVRQRDSGVREALVSGLATAFEKNRAELARVGLVDSRSADQLEQFIELAKDARTQFGHVKRIAIMLFRHWKLLLGAALVLASLAWAAIAMTGEDLAGAITVVVGAAATLLPFIRNGLKVIESVVIETAPFADSIEEAEGKGLKALVASEVKVRQAREEAEALRGASERADRALARYVDPNATANPPRLLRYLLEDDPDTKAFEKEIGLLGRARRLFQALDQIVIENRRKQEKERKAGNASTGSDSDAPDPDIPARIILYIDDLDRCTHDQVYKVLQAIHLLLAFELFVVVVAVDVAWIEAALARSIEFAGADTKNEAAKEVARRQRAIEYLSKIFQLPFWLKPFSGKDDVRYAAYVRSLTRAAAEPKPEDGERERKLEGAAPPAPPPSGDKGGEDHPPGDSKTDEAGGRREEEEAPPGEEENPRPDSRPDEVARALRTLQLSRDEEDFLASPEIAALAAPDPRGVKRLVNVYKIVRSRLSEADEASILGDDGRAPIFPIIAVCAAVETGQPLNVADAFYNQVKLRAEISGLTSDLPVKIETAIAAALALRGGHPATASDFLAVARVVRRYSFNRYH